MEPLPIDMFELVSEEVGRFTWAEAVQSVNKRVSADNPKHVEAAQRVYGHQALGCDSGLRFPEFLCRGRSGGQSCHTESALTGLGEEERWFKAKRTGRLHRDCADRNVGVTTAEPDIPVCPC